MCFGCAWFASRMGNQLSWLLVFVVLLSLFSFIPGHNSNYATTSDISGFCRCPVSPVALLGCLASEVGSCPRTWTALTLKMKMIRYPETSVTNYQHRPHNIPQERRPPRTQQVTSDLLQFTTLYHRLTGWYTALLTHCGRVTQICVFNTVKLGTSASSP